MSLDREAAREIVRQVRGGGLTQVEALDMLEGCVRPVSAQTIDRDALVTFFTTTFVVDHGEDMPAHFADQVLALLRPVEQQTIDRDALLVELMQTPAGMPWHERADRVLALLRPVDGVTLTRKEAKWLLDVAADGVAILDQWVIEEERENPESEDAIRYGVRADCGRRAMERLKAASGE